MRLRCVDCVTSHLSGHVTYARSLIAKNAPLRTIAIAHWLYIHSWVTSNEFQWRIFMLFESISEPIWTDEGIG